MRTSLLVWGSREGGLFLQSDFPRPGAMVRAGWTTTNTSTRGEAGLTHTFRYNSTGGISSGLGLMPPYMPIMVSGGSLVRHIVRLHRAIYDVRQPFWLIASRLPGAAPGREA
jgi:hypothetical protein